MNRKTAIVSLLSVAACADRAYAKPTSPVIGFRLASFGHTSIIDPYSTTAPNVSDIAWLFADGLIGTDGYAPRGLLATRIPSSMDGSISQDGKDIYYELRRNVRWHDGKPFEADDVVTAFRRIQDSPWRTSRPYGLVRSIKVLDSYKVRVGLTERDPRFPLGFFSAYGDPNIPLIRPGRLPIGTGPFVLEGRSEYTGSYSFHRWNASARRTSLLDTLSYSFIPDQATEAIGLVSGTFDAALYVPPAIVQAHHLRTAQYTGGTLALIANVSGHLADIRLRRIVWNAIDRESIREKVFAGWSLPADSILPPDIAGPSPFAHRVATSINELRRGASVASLNTLSLTFASIPGVAERIGLLLAAQLNAIGIRLTIKNYSPQEYFSPNGPLRSGRFDLALNFMPNSLDPDFTSAFGCRGQEPLSTNFLRFCDRSLDEAIERGRYREMESILAEQSVALPIAHILHCVGLGPRVGHFRVQDYVPITYFCYDWSLA